MPRRYTVLATAASAWVVLLLLAAFPRAAWPQSPPDATHTGDASSAANGPRPSSATDARDASSATNAPDASVARAASAASAANARDAATAFPGDAHPASATATTAALAATATAAAPRDAASATDAAGSEHDAAGSDASPSAQAAPSPVSNELTLPPAPIEATQQPGLADRPPPTREVPVSERPAVLIKTILGLIALLALAYIGGHPRVQRVERAIGISQVITAGFPFVALGVLARTPTVGILTDSVLNQLGPLLRFGLGWIGFIIGFRFDTRLIESAPKGIATLVATRALTTFAVIVGACSILLFGASSSIQSALTNPVFLRDALILGTAGSLTALTTPRLLAARGGATTSVNLVAHIARLEELVGILGLLFIAAYFRPSGRDVTWQLPGTAWLLLTLGLGAAMGTLVFAILLRRTTNRAESMVLILGSVAFAAGLAAHLRLSPVVVSFVAGMILANFPGHYRARIEATMVHLERPIYLLFLLVVGALWNVGDPRGWALMGAFVLARLAGKWLSLEVSSRQAGVAVPSDARVSLVVAPMGALSIAIVIDAQMLYPGGSVPRIMTAVVGGAIVTEVLVQLFSRGTRSSAPPAEIEAANSVVGGAPVDMGGARDDTPPSGERKA